MAGVYTFFYYYLQEAMKLIRLENRKQKRLYIYIYIYKLAVENTKNMHLA
jgi:hypothetical protein